MDYATRRAIADQWTRAAERQLRGYEWVPADLERRVAAEVMRATRSPSVSHPPHHDLDLGLRLARLTTLAPAYRLGLMAGGWTLPAGGIGAPEPDARVGLGQLLAAVHLVAELAESWNARYNSLFPHYGTPDGLATAARRTLEEIPDLATDLDAMECRFGGFGDVGEVFAAIASGDVS